jgi:hypothetical protein
MAYDPLLNSEIEAGDPVKKELFEKIKNNEDDLNTRLDAVEQTSTISMFNIKFGGDINNYTVDEIGSRIPVHRTALDGTIVSFVVTLLTDSTSGTLELEIDKSTDDGVNWVNLLSSPVEVTGSSTGSISGIVNWTSPAAQDFLQGDLHRVRVIGLQVDQGEFHVHIYGEVS